MPDQVTSPVELDLQITRRALANWKKLGSGWKSGARGLILTETGPAGESFEIPPLSPALGDLVTGAWWLGMPRAFAEMVLRVHLMRCNATHTDKYQDAIRLIAQSNRMPNASFGLLANSLVAPTLAREGRRWSVKFWHLRFQPVFTVLGALVAISADLAWWMRLLSLAGFFASNVVLALTSYLFRKARGNKPIQASLAADYFRISLLALIGIALAFVPHELSWGISYGASSSFFAAAAWMLFSELSGLYGARGNLRSRGRELNGLVGIKLLDAVHSLARHGERIEASAALYEAAHASHRAVLSTRGGSGTQFARRAATQQAVAVRNTLVAFGDAVSEGRKKGSPQVLFAFVAGCFVSIADGRWDEIAKQGPKTGSIPAPVRRNPWGLVIRLAPAVVALAAFVLLPAGPEWRWVPIAAFAIIVTLAAIVDFLRPRARLDEAISVAALSLIHI